MAVSEPLRLDSTEDLSTNFVFEEDGSAFREARYVRRTDDYFIVYLSSHDGCRMGCRFCHLTATKQVSFNETSFEGFMAQADAVLAHYDAVRNVQGNALRVHFNWMARGEPLANYGMLANFEKYIRPALLERAHARSLDARFLISSIIPRAGLHATDLAACFKSPDTTLYYSLYSMRPKFRRAWLPNAMDPNEALDLLARWQTVTGNTLALHWAFIAGENDDDGTVDEIIEAVTSRNLRAKFNLVRYNPASPAHGREPDEATLHRQFARIQAALGDHGSRIVPRVGVDVKASCGMFYAGV